jgi:dynactin complex subunit
METIKEQTSILNFVNFLQFIISYNSKRIEDKLEFIFRLLDSNNFQSIKITDICRFIKVFNKTTYKLGDICHICYDNRVGVIKYLGPIDLKQGEFAGLELFEGGKNDGSVDGKKYFDCKQNAGIFVLTESLEVESDYEESKLVLELLFKRKFSVDDGVELMEFLELKNDIWVQQRFSIDPFLNIFKY